MFHVYVSEVKKGQGATGMATYLAREDQDSPSQKAMYLARSLDDAKDDLVLYEEYNLPAWADNGAHFFALAERHEARKDGVVAKLYQVSLPRELSPQGRIDLAQDIAAAYFSRFPHLLAIHNPLARDGGEQPHVHYMLYLRPVDGVERDVTRYFASPNRAYPERGGVAKDRTWGHPSTIGRMRECIATLTNAALEREGHSITVSHKTLRQRDVPRDPEVRLTNPERIGASKGRVSAKHQANLQHREGTNTFWKPWEEKQNKQLWEDYKARTGLDTGRDAVVAHVRDTFWQPPAQQKARLQRMVVMPAQVAESLEERTGRAAERQEDVQAAVVMRATTPLAQESMPEKPAPAHDPKETKLVQRKEQLEARQAALQGQLKDLGPSPTRWWQFGRKGLEPGRQGLLQKLDRVGQELKEVEQNLATHRGWKHASQRHWTVAPPAYVFGRSQDHGKDVDALGQQEEDQVTALGQRKRDQGMGY